jgi:phosphoribosylformylglycinamidine synthase
MSNQDVSIQVAGDLGINQEMFERIVQTLGRQPNFLELQIYSVMWSENISYKSSYKWINSLPNKGEAIVLGAGEGSAGVVNIGNGHYCVFKMGTHNHPAGIDPFQGAATCVGDVCRDVYTLGAEPVAVISSLRFGMATLDRTQWLMKEVMKGINDYSQDVGLLNHGGEICFHSSFDTNPLVNVMVAGVVPSEKLIWNRPLLVGQSLYIVGAPTGKDGVFGTDEGFTISRGNPKLARRLIQLVQELNDKRALVRLENMDMAGIVNAAASIGVHGNLGVSIDIDKVKLFDDGMLDEEILLSRTQERVMMVVPTDKIEIAEEIFEKSNLSYSRIGLVQSGDRVKFYHGDACVADFPAADLVMGYNSPSEDRDYTVKEEEPNRFNCEEVAEPDDYWKVINKMVDNPNVVIKEYLQITQEGEGHNSPSDAQVVWLDGYPESLCFAVSGNSIYCKNDPNIGTQINVAKAVRRIVCSGGKPLAMNDCLNFGSPFDETVFTQFVNSVQGISKAAKIFDTPVAGGNVSFFNESSVLGKREPIYPTSVIGMMGVIHKKENHTSYMFRGKGDMIFLLGKSRNDIAGSVYLCTIHEKCVEGVPYFNPEEELSLLKVTDGLIESGLVNSAHSVGRGGLFFNLLESTMPLGFGFDITSPAEVRKDAFLFGESQGRIVVSVPMEHEDEFVDFMMATNVPFSTLGHVTKGELRIDDISYGFVEEYKEKYLKFQE